MIESKKRVIVALDDMSLSQAVTTAELLKDYIAGVKVGFELLSTEGAKAITQAFKPFGVIIFVDPKLHDIPKTAALTAKKLVRLGVGIINLHCSGGKRMMAAVRQAVDEVWENEREQYGLTRKPLVIGVTVLTSLDYDELAEAVFPVKEDGTEMISSADYSDERKLLELRRIAIKMALNAAKCGLDGVVTSPLEAGAIRAATVGSYPQFQIITPGIRLADGKADDQVRIDTPARSISAGADWLVIGRPVTTSSDPRATVEIINAQVEEALATKGGKN